MSSWDTATARRTGCKDREDSFRSLFFTLGALYLAIAVACFMTDFKPVTAFCAFVFVDRHRKHPPDVQF